MAIVGSLIALACLSGAAAFRAASAPARCSFESSLRGLDHYSRSCQTHRPIKVAAARSEGYDDWCIDDEENGSDNASCVSSSARQDRFDNDKDEDTRVYFATCIPGLQDVLASELVGLGASRVEVQGKSGVRFQGSAKVGMISILWCRTAHKIMELISSSSDPPRVEDEFESHAELDFSSGIRNREDLYEFTRSAVHTPSLLGDGSGGLLTLSVATIYASKAPNKELCHGHFTALTVKNALVDDVRNLREGGDRPNVDLDDADVPLVIVIRSRRAGGGRGRDWRDKHDERYEEDEFVADVDLYRVLHAGGSLHRRGYRKGNQDLDWDAEDDEYGEYEKLEVNARSTRPQASIRQAPIHRAAMKETLAAGLLLEAGWDKLVLAARDDGKGAVLADPMTGSGTLPVEAALIAADMAPGLLRIASWRGDGRTRVRNPHRHPPCTRWKDFGDVETWDELVAQAARRAKSATRWALSSRQGKQGNVSIVCNEKNPRAASLARSSIQNAGVSSMISLSEGDCIDWNLGGADPSDPQSVIEGRTIFVCNPPWGLRLTEGIDNSWVSLREFLRREAGGCEAWILSGNKALTKILRMKKSRTLVVKTAEEDLRWLQYHIFRKKEAETEVIA